MPDDIEYINWGYPLFYIAILFLGCCVGSYLNVVIYRLPLGLSTNDPKRSFCPNCKLAIPFYRNIPIFTWLVQRGKCSGCEKPIAVRYLLVELLTGLVWLGLWWWFAVYSPENGLGNYPEYLWYPPMLALFFIVLFTLGIAIFFIDIEHLIIPQQLTVFAAVVALIGAGALPWHLGVDSLLEGLKTSVIGGVVGFFVLWGAVLLGKLLFGRIKINSEKALAWHVREPDEESEDPNENLSLVIDGEDNFWQDIFFRKSDKLKMSGVTDLEINGESLVSDNIVFNQTQVIYNEGVIEIEDLKSISGKVRSLVIPREAMGMGDVHLLGAMGLVFGVDSLLMVILASCLFGIVIHILVGGGLGKQVPFGPSLLLGGVVWLFFGPQLFEWCMICLNDIIRLPAWISIF